MSVADVLAFVDGTVKLVRSCLSCLATNKDQLWGVGVPCHYWRHFRMLGMCWRQKAAFHQLISEHYGNMEQFEGVWPVSKVVPVKLELTVESPNGGGS